MKKIKLSEVRLFDGPPLYFRQNSSDSYILQKTFGENNPEYKFPAPGDFSPKFIMDIGANIGGISVHLARRYPKAKILAFEPVKENFEILEKNVEPYENIVPFNFGLGAKHEDVSIYESSDKTNFGAFSVISNRGTDKHETVNIRNPMNVLAMLNLKDIDLIKIDTEGMEIEILASMWSVAQRTPWIFGEIHDLSDFSLLKDLGKTHKVQFEKNFNEVVFQFAAQIR